MTDLGKIMGLLITPFTDEEMVDHHKAAELAKEAAKSPGADSLTVAATAGEFASLTFEERIKLFKTVKAAVDKPVIAGTGAITTRETIALTKAAEEETKVDAVVIMTPYFCNPTQKEAYEHIKSVAQATKLPVLLYNYGLTGVILNIDTIVELSKITNIVGMKQAANPMDIPIIVRRAAHDFRVYSDPINLFLGAPGMLGLAFPPLLNRMREVIEQYEAGKEKEAFKLCYDLVKYGNIFYRNNPAPPFKCIMNLAGYQVGKPRLPLTEATEQERERIKKVLLDLKFIESEA